jgi:hypothetical protein
MKQNIFSVKSPLTTTSCKTTVIHHILDSLIILLLIPKVLDKNLLQNVGCPPWVLVVIQNVFYLYHVSKLIRAFTSPKKWQNVCTVRVLPFGIQIEERTVSAATKRSNSIDDITNMCCKKPKDSILTNDDPEKVMFIPSECILDVVVLEIVLSYKVISVVAFRVDKQGMVDESLRVRVLHDSSLVIAFHPDKVHMSYVECINMWKGIREAIQKST